MKRYNKSHSFRKKNNYYKKKILFMVAVILIIVVGVFAIMSSLLLSSDEIMKGVFIESTPVSGMTLEEAEKKISEEYEVKTVKLKSQENNYDIDLEEKGFAIDSEGAVKKAYEVGRNKGFFKNFAKAFRHKFLGEKEVIKISEGMDLALLDDDIQKIKEELDISAKDATIDLSQGITVVPEVMGKEVNADKLKEDIKKYIKNTKDRKTIEIPIETTEPRIKEEDLQSINGAIGYYSTKFSNPGGDRAYNVGLAAKRVSNVVLMPGDEMSFLNRLGEISVNSGYKASTVIINNERVDGIGGGVCQVSTNLYNAVLLSGLKVTTRRNHSLPIDYVPLGRDATVAEGGPDLVFRNDYPFPVFIVNYTSGSYMISEIYGDTTRADSVSLSSKVLETYPQETKYVDDPSLPEGKEEVEKNGSTGYKVATYITRNGETNQLTVDVYQKMDRVIKKGTGPAEEPEAKEEGVKTNQAEAQPEPQPQLPTAEETHEEVIF